VFFFFYSASCNTRVALDPLMDIKSNLMDIKSNFTANPLRNEKAVAGVAKRVHSLWFTWFKVARVGALYSSCQAVTDCVPLVCQMGSFGVKVLSICLHNVMCDI
jgi:hypothetical protein